MTGRCVHGWSEPVPGLEIVAAVVKGRSGMPTVRRSLALLGILAMSLVGGLGFTSTPAGAASPPSITVVAAPASVSPGETLVVRWLVEAEAGLGWYGDVDGMQPGTWAKLGGPGGWVSWCGFPLRTIVESSSAGYGTFSISCRIPDVVPNGSYTLFLEGFDGAAVYAAEQRVTFEVVGGSVDGAAPRISEVSVDSPAVPGADVAISWRATDETGVASVIPWAFGPNGRVTDESGALWLGFAAGTLVSGTDRDGRYSVSLPLIAAAVDGTYTIWFSVLDTVGNREPTLGPEGPGSVYATFTVGGSTLGGGTTGGTAGGATTGSTIPPGADGATDGVIDGVTDGSSGGASGGATAGGATTGSTIPPAAGESVVDLPGLTDLIAATRVTEAPGIAVASAGGLALLVGLGYRRSRRRPSA